MRNYVKLFESWLNEAEEQNPLLKVLGVTDLKKLKQGMGKYTVKDFLALSDDKKLELIEHVAKTVGGKAANTLSFNKKGSYIIANYGMTEGPMEHYVTASIPTTKEEIVKILSEGTGVKMDEELLNYLPISGIPVKEISDLKEDSKKKKFTSYDTLSMAFNNVNMFASNKWMDRHEERFSMDQNKWYSKTELAKIYTDSDGYIADAKSNKEYSETESES